LEGAWKADGGALRFSKSQNPQAVKGKQKKKKKNRKNKNKKRPNKKKKKIHH